MFDVKPSIALPDLPFADRTLANGLRVVTVADPRSPTVAINVGYHVGGKDDPPGRSGFAHLFEHLMFKGTPTSGPETIDRLTEDVGGYNNAFTTEDLTNYYEVIPANYLETLLWAEADRLAHLSITDENFATERDVVIGEYDQHILADPYGMLDELVNQEAFRVHPYGRGVIGNPDQLRASSLADVIAFHDTYYRPDNAVLVVVGDFDPDRTAAWIDDYFGPIERPRAPIPRVAVTEPAQTQARRYVHHATGAPLPALELAFRIPTASDPDAPALDMVETLLGSGKSSRLYEALVYREQIASYVGATAEFRADDGLFHVRAVLNAGRTVDEARAAIARELARIGTEPLEPGELEKAKTLVFTSLARSRQTPSGVALTLLRAAILRGSPAAANTDTAGYAAVTDEDVHRVARATFTERNTLTIEYLPA